MKRKPLLLSVLVAVDTSAGSVSLRGKGVEERLGEQTEKFLSENFYSHVDRRVLVDEEGTYLEDFFDEWPDQDIVGKIVENEDQVYVEEWYQGDDNEEEDDEKDLLGYSDSVDEWIGRDIAVNDVVQDNEDHNKWFDQSESEEDFEQDALTIKEYAPDPDSLTVVGTDIMGKDVDQFNRREAACGGNKSEFKIMLTTDHYGYETEWKLINIQDSRAIAQGPPSDANYADKTTYTGRWCLAPGQYKFRMIDNGRDGICSNNPVYGCGRLMLFLNGQNAGRMLNDKSNWQTKDFPFLVGIASRIDGADNNSNGNSNNINHNNNNGNGQWCKKVRSVMQVPKGTCILPNGHRGHRVRVLTKIDKYGKETSWQITHKSGNVVKMKMGPVIEPNQSKSVEECLPAGKYNIRFQDLDGICCRHGQGFFKLIVNGKELLNGGSFIKAISYDFQLGFDWISSMSERDCEWWWAHDYRRRDWHTRCYPGQYCNKTYRHLRWSPALKEDAKVYAEKLLDSCEANGIRHDTTEQGENISKNRGFGNWGALYPADNVTKRFVDNEEFWGWSRNSHLTQAMWYPTRYIGCAESVKNMGNNKMCRMQVCRYAKAGNCLMSKYNSSQGNNWMTPMMMDDSPCGPMCASRDGCYH